MHSDILKTRAQACIAKVFAEEPVYYVQYWNFGTIGELLSDCNAKKKLIRTPGSSYAWSQASSFIVYKRDLLTDFEFIYWH